MHNKKNSGTIKIYYDVTHVISVNEQMTFHGGGYYGLKLLKRMLNYNKRNVDFVLLWPDNYFISDCEEKELWENETIEKILVEKIEDVEFEENSLLVFPNFNCNSTENYKMLKKIYQRNQKIKIVTTIHDMRFLIDLHCDFYNRYYHDCKGIIRYIGGYLRELYHVPKTLIRAPLIFRRVNHLDRMGTIIFTPSNFSLQQLLKYSKVVKIQWFFQDITTNMQKNVVAGLEKKGFILFVSGNRQEKNFARTLIAYIKSVKEGKTIYPLCVTGSEKSIRAIVNRIPNIDREICNKMVRYLGFVSESEMQWLYSSCVYLLYTSKFEGFGLPACNALLYGRPVIASNRTSIPEVCGSSALYVNPYNMESIKRGIDFFSDKSILNIYEENTKRYSDILKEMGRFGEDMMIQTVYQLL